MTFTSIRQSWYARLLSVSIIVTFMTSMVITPRVSYAQEGVMGLPQPGAMVNLSSSYVPLMVTGLTVHPENPLLMDFIVNTGNSGLKAGQIKKESDRLIKYFLACLTIPEGDQWVNLSPYEKQRIIPTDLGQTVLGQDMLAQDYLLKQLTASLIYPEKNLGKNFWDKVYAKASAMYGTTQVPVNTFNKVWILPDTAKVFEHKNTVFVVKSHLKVMLDEDYLALSRHSNKNMSSPNVLVGDPGGQINNLGSQIIRQIILPAIEQEVNQGQNFAQMRQIYNSMILAVWFKNNLKEALLNQVYTDKSKVNGVNVDDPAIKERIYKQYLEAYKKGVFNYIKEEPADLSLRGGNADEANSKRTTIARKYFSGGLTPVTNFAMATADEARNAFEQSSGLFYSVRGLTTNAAMTTQADVRNVGAIINVDNRHQLGNLQNKEKLDISFSRNIDLYLLHYEHGLTLSFNLQVGDPDLIVEVGLGSNEQKARAVLAHHAFEGEFLPGLYNHLETFILNTSEFYGWISGLLAAIANDVTSPSIPTPEKAMTTHAKILSQDELKAAYEAQQAKDLPTIQAMQGSLKMTMLDGYEQAWQQYTKERPVTVPFDLKNPEEQTFVYTRQEAEDTNLRTHLKEFIKKSNASTAGIRAFIDILHSENPNKMYNDRFMALLIDAEAEFLSDVHKEVSSKIPDIENKKKMKAFIGEIRKNMGRKNVRLVEEIYGMPLEELIPFLKNNIVKLVGGEVRAHTAKFVEMEARILAQQGITVITTPEYSDSVTIYMFSFLTYLLGAAGATHYTSSHSADYLFGRKALSPNGSQLLPDVYEKYRTILTRKIEQEIYGPQGETTVVMGRADNINIKRTLTYERMTKLYASILNLTKKDIKLINEAAQKGHKIVLNCLNGSTWKTLLPLMKNLGINPDVFTPVMLEEDPYFNVGFEVIKSTSPSGEVFYSVDHLGVDTTMPRIVRTIPYPNLLKGMPVGTRVYEVDPDSDRFVFKQILAATPKVKRQLAEFGIDFYPLEGNKILIAPSPNKSFLMLDIADVERMIADGTWDEFQSLYLITYVSSRAWVEFADAVKSLMRIMSMVGFKNLADLQTKIEDWYNNRTNEPEFSFKDNLDRVITIDRSKKIRIHSKQEESGGRVAGLNSPCFNVLGDKVLAMPEKSAADSLFSELLFSSKVYLAAAAALPAGTKIDGPSVFKRAVQGSYSFLNYLSRSFKKYGLKSKIDVRIDIIHGKQGAIAGMNSSEQQKAMAESEAIKTNFNNFFFSMAKAVRDGEMPLSRVISMLTKISPKYADTWACLTEKTLTEEILAGGKTRPEGVPMVFELTGGKIPLVTGMSFRPSGTDPLRSKVYLDAETLTPEQRSAFEAEFDDLQKYDLYPVLEEYGVKPIIPKPDGLRLLDIATRGSGTDSAMSPGGIDLASKHLKMQSEGEKVNIAFNPAMIAQFKRGDFSGVRIKIIDVIPVNLIPLLGLKEDEQSGLVKVI